MSDTIEKGREYLKLCGQGNSRMIPTDYLIESLITELEAAREVADAVSWLLNAPSEGHRADALFELKHIFESYNKTRGGEDA